MNSYIELGNKYVTRKKMRALLVIISMVLASMLIYVVVTAGLGTYMHARAEEEAWANYYVSYYDLSDAQFDTVKNHANVESCVRGGNVGPKLIGVDNEFYVPVTPQNYYDWYFFHLMEMESFEQDIFADTLVEGRVPENSSEIMLCETDVHRFTEEVKLGDTIVMNFREAEESQDDAPQREATKEYVLCGIYKSEGAASWTNTGYTLADDTSGLNTYVRFRRKYHWRDDASALANLISMKPDKYGRQYEMNSPLDAYYFQNDMVFVMAIMVLMFAVLLIYFCMVMVRSLMSVNVINKLRDYTILKSMGATNKQLRKIMMRESVMQGCIAFVIGAVAGQLFLSLVLVRYGQLYSLSFRYIWMALLVNAFFLWLTIELAAIEPFFMLKKVSIVEALGQRELIKHSKRNKKPGLFYRKLSIEGQYAYKNMKRNRKSFWNSVAAFTISILIITTMMATLANAGILVEDEEYVSGGPQVEGYAYDIRIPLSYNEQGFNADYKQIEKAKQALEAREDVLEADYIAYGLTVEDPVNGLQYRLEAKDTLKGWMTSEKIVEISFLSESQLKRLNEYMLDGVDACEAVRDGGIIVLGYADFDGQKDLQFYDLKVGDRISLGSLDVIKEIQEKNEEMGAYGYGSVSSIQEIEERKAYDQYIVKGICRMNNLLQSFPKMVIMSYEYVKDTYGEDFIKKYISHINVKIDEKNFDKDAFENIVGSQPALMSWGYIDVKRSVAEETRIMKYIGIFIVVFIAIMGVVSMLNTMINDQIQRKKENAILRAIGMSRSGLNKMLVMEKMLVGFMAWFIGTGLSIILSFLFTIAFRYMTEAKFVFPWYICGITAAVMFTIMAILSGLMILMVGKMDITEGIRNEG